MSGSVSPQIRGGKIGVPSAALPKDIQTGKEHPVHTGPAGPMVVQRGTGTTIDRMMSMGRPSVNHPHQTPLPGGASAAGAPGSVLWASGA